MSSKDKSKIPSTKVQGNIIEDRDLSVKKVSKKSGDKEKPKIDRDKLALKEDRPSSKRAANTVIGKGSDNNADIISRNTQNKNEDDVEEKRRKRKEKESIHQADKEREKNRDFDKSNLKENKKKDYLDQEDSNNRHKTDKSEFNNKHRSDKEESKIRHRADKEEESKSRHRTDKDEQSKIKNRTEKEDLKIRSKTDNVESNSKQRPDKDESKRRHRSDKDETSKEKPDKEESKSRHRADKVESDNKHNTDKTKEEDRRKPSSRRDKNATDGRGDKIATTNGKLPLDKRDNQYSINVSDGRFEKKVESVEYEEDFEDYNDDFEELNSSSSAISEDKEVIEDSSQSISPKEVVTKPPLSRERHNSPKEAPKNKDGIHTSFINFRLAQKKCSNDAVANRMLSRAYDLSRLIDLDRSHFDILDVPPVLEHSKYMLMFGRAGCQHIGCQTGDDNMGRESQTEVIDERTLWSQHPPLDDEGCVRVMLDTSRNNLSPLLANDSSKTALEMLNESGVSSAPLVHVLELMDRVLEEEASPEVSTKIPSATGGQQLMSLGYNKYSCESLPCIRAIFSMGNSAIFATVHQQCVDGGEGNGGNSKSFVSIWRVSSNYREPQRFLSCPNHNETKSCITSLIFSPDTCPSHLFGGLDSGLIALWDLREHSTLASSAGGDPPAYFTGVPSDVSNQNHQNPIIALHTSSTKTTASSYQLLSLDSSGNLSVWIVSSLAQNGYWAVASGSLADLNLRPGSRSRMSIIATVSLFSGLSYTASSITCMTVDPANPSHIFIGNQNGQIIHHDRSVQKPLQGRNHSHGRVYGSNASFESGSIMFLDFYPFFEPYFLAGYSDGSLKIFTVGRSEALITFSSKHRAAILMCRWSKSHPAVFFCLDCDGNFHIWNILLNIYKPIFAQILPRYIGFDLSCDSRWHSPEDRSVNNKARLLIWALDGSIEVHELQPSFVVPELDDCFKTCSFLQSLL